MRRTTSRLLRVKHHSSPLPQTISSNMNRQPWSGVSLSDLPKSHIFTTHLPPDPALPSPQLSKEASPEQLRISRLVKNGLFTWVAPETTENPQLLATSWKAVRDLGLNVEEVESEEFLKLISGNMIYEEHYPWGERHALLTMY